MPKQTTRRALQGATIPTNMLLRLLRQGLDDGSIQPAQVRDLLGPRADGREIVPGDVLEAMRREAKRHNLASDGLRFTVQRRKQGFALMLVLEDSGHVAAPRLNTRFADADGLPAAAEAIVGKYLLALCGDVEATS